MGNVENDEVKTFSLTEIFNSYFPHFLAMGMPSEEFWHDDFNRVKGYREAYKLKQEVKDCEFWRQGVYFYEALLDVSPILHAFAKKGTKPRPYPEQPYGLELPKTQEEEQKKVENERIKTELHFRNLTKILEKKFGGQNGS